ncbi:MAG TPA: tyrosine--tRNA ligase [Phycisphaerales bacterium]|nr:tyrosine--tRNA ligase [Phycisphaerales bacterium]HCD31537.1 tyrosine--tRNA ligase [Phycisphaerales bacterium]
MENLQNILDELQRGVDSIYSLEELKRKLESGRTLNIKLGMDPTAPDIHLGHTVVLRKMRQFQDLGHKATLIIGDYTARIGDPTGRDSTRPILDEATIAANADTYLQQAGKILDTSPEKLEVRYNSEWLAKLGFADVLKLTGQVTVGQMLHRENFKLRMAQEKEIVISEFMYPLMQAYDSVVIKADVELGGTDQTFNNLMGRQLQEKDGQEKQVVIVMPILVGLDGHEKMSKSKGNYVAVTDEPNDMFGKIMSIPDELMKNYYELLTGLPTERIGSLLDDKMTHPREAKDILGRVIVEEFYSPGDAVAASEEFRRRFAENKLPADLPTVKASSNPIGLLALIREAGFASSNSEARRFVEQGAVSLNGEKTTDAKATIQIADKTILKVGKRKICEVSG